MTSWEFESELAEKFELTTERYWVDGMSLSDARKKASSELMGHDNGEARQVGGSAGDPSKAYSGRAMR
ncbi:hypothetical protein [Allopontixanthobacter sp.]|uniref:hypothetical protein n=1 Tax=Allopontixanthobacter sp. TaxID=2906452 RepID=UPI002AB9B73A|nr:hypothetical protein [Allopontixanthobacter sp.]MDZ4308285.1 hypothetical protein [Allopontixanthobacter sp.]